MYRGEKLTTIWEAGNLSSNKLVEQALTETFGLQFPGPGLDGTNPHHAALLFLTDPDGKDKIPKSKVGISLSTGQNALEIRLPKPSKLPADSIEQISNAFKETFDSSFPPPSKMQTDVITSVRQSDLSDSCLRGHYRGSRRYSNGDSIRMVDWKRAAKVSSPYDFTLYVKEFDSEPPAERLPKYSNQVMYIADGSLIMELIQKKDKESLVKIFTPIRQLVDQNVDTTLRISSFSAYRDLQINKEAKDMEREILQLFIWGIEAAAKLSEFYDKHTQEFRNHDPLAFNETDNEKYDYVLFAASKNSLPQALRAARENENTFKVLKSLL